MPQGQRLLGSGWEIALGAVPDDQVGGFESRSEHACTSIPFTRRGGVAVSTTFAPKTAQNIDPMLEATARAAAKAGMTVEQWIAHTDQIEARHTNRRRVEQMMQQAPRYRGEDAA